MCGIPKDELMDKVISLESDPKGSYRIAKYLNYLVICLVVIIVIGFTFISPPEQMVLGARLLASFSFLLLLIPNIFTLCALPPKLKLRKTTISVIILFCFLVVLGMVYGPGSTETFVGSIVYLMICIFNLIFIIKSRPVRA